MLARFLLQRVVAGVVGCLLVGQELNAQEPQRWRLAPEAIVGASYDFTRVSGLLPLASGSVAVVDGGNHELVVFRSDGGLSHRVGRSGRGPGEYLRISSAGSIGDTLWVIDHGQRRILLYAAGGTPIRTITYAPAIALTAVLPAGLAVGTQPTALGSQQAFRDARLPLILANREGSVRDTLAQLASRNRWLVLPTRQGGYTMLPGEQLFSDATIVVLTPDGQGLYVVDRAPATSTGSATFRVVAFAPDGRTRWNRSYSYTARRVEQARSDSLWREVQRRFRRSEHAEADVRRALFLPEFYPPITSAFAGRDGALWLRREESKEADVAYVVISADGTSKATLSVPLGLTLVAADGNRVWGVQKDEFDVPTVHRFRLEMVR